MCLVFSEHFSLIFQYYKLTADIDLSGIEWTNLGDFEGVFDGNGYSIKNMSNVSTVVDKNMGIGLFADTNGIFQNLTLKNVLVMITMQTTTETTCDFSFGGISCGNSSIFKIKNCHAEVDLHVKNTTNGAIYVGGFAGGYGYNSIIIEKSSVNINAVIGGKLGFENCYIGGLVTHPNEGLIVNSFTEGNIVVDVDNAFNEDVYLGGLCARTLYNTPIINSYSSCNIELSDIAWGRNVGGLLGFGCSGGSTIRNSYYSGTISIFNDGNSYGCDGLVAAFGEAAKIDNCYSSYASDFCEEKTLEGLTSVDFQTTVLGWSTDDWIFVEGQHPTLKRGN